MDISILGCCSGISIMSEVSCVQLFEWNVEASLTTMQDFEWGVGEGPLYWWRVEFQQGNCPPNSCIPSISDCIFSVPSSISCCSFVCPPDNCISIDHEIWTMLATSVEHLCERLSGECCNRRPQGFIKSVKKYQRPALCCDVKKFEQDGTPIIDEYEDVDFAMICKCASFINPCDMTIIYPCPTSACITNQDSLPTSFAAFNQSWLEPIEPESKVTFSRFGGEVPVVLRLTHNFNQIEVLQSFLKRNNFKLPINFPLKFQNSTDSWMSTLNFIGQNESWTMVSECKKMEENELNRFGWRLSVAFTRKIGQNKKTTRLSLDLASKGFRANKNRFELAFNFNTQSKSLVSRSGISIHSKYFLDDAGLFQGAWKNDPFLKLKVGL